VAAAWKFPVPFERVATDKDTFEDRIEKEKLSHTGRLHVKILKAENLRIADVISSDPYAVVYVRNQSFKSTEDDIRACFGQGGWKIDVMGVHKHSFKTTVKLKTIHPEWNEETEIELQTGAFEKRAAHHWRLDLTQRSQQQHQDEEASAAFGGDDLQIFFPDPDGNHGVKIYLGDTIHQFKEKLRTACHKKAEAATYKKQEKFQAAAKNISHQHTVMVFVPSLLLLEHGRHRDRYKIEERDPSNWQPLDSACTFGHYAARYGFGLPVPPRLRITEGTDAYKLRNNRFRHFENEQKRRNKHLHDLNTELECFGYAQYTHSHDGGSTEWREAIMDRPEQSRDSHRRFKVLFIHTPQGLTDPVPRNLSEVEHTNKKEL